MNIFLTIHCLRKGAAPLTEYPASRYQTKESWKEIEIAKDILCRSNAGFIIQLDFEIQYFPIRVLCQSYIAKFCAAKLMTFYANDFCKLMTKLMTLLFRETLHLYMNRGISASTRTARYNAVI